MMVTEIGALASPFAIAALMLSPARQLTARRLSRLAPLWRPTRSRGLSDVKRAPRPLMSAVFESRSSSRFRRVLSFLCALSRSALKFSRLASAEFHLPYWRGSAEVTPDSFKAASVISAIKRRRPAHAYLAFMSFLRWDFNDPIAVASFYALQGSLYGFIGSVGDGKFVLQIRFHQNSAECF